MKVDDLMKMTVEDLLNEFCILYSPECDYNYGIGRWDDVGKIFEEYDLEDHYCFDGDYLITLDYCFDCGEKVLELEDLHCIMDKLGIIKKQYYLACGSEEVHLIYNLLKIKYNDFVNIKNE